MTERKTDLDLKIRNNGQAQNPRKRIPGLGLKRQMMPEVPKRSKLSIISFPTHKSSVRFYKFRQTNTNVFSRSTQSQFHLLTQSLWNLRNQSKHLFFHRRWSKRLAEIIKFRSQISTILLNPALTLSDRLFTNRFLRNNLWNVKQKRINLQQSKSLEITT